MRILYADPHNLEESDALAEVAARIDAWWVDFAARADALARTFRTGADLGDIPAWMTLRLRAIVPGVCWEFGPPLRGQGFRLVITCEAEHALRPLVNLLLARAPKLPGWEFYQYRPAESLELTAQTLRGRTGGSLAGLTVHAAHARFNRVDLSFHSPDYSGPDDLRAIGDVQIVAETLLGEEILHKWIGAISIVALPDPKAITLAKLKQVVEAKIAITRKGFPPVPRYDRSYPLFTAPQLSAFQFNTHPAVDYVGRRGIVMLHTREPDVFRAPLKGRPFFSETFSNQHETFCYLKIDSTGDEGPGRRLELETALNKMLESARLGCVIGGAVGLRYSYIDLALVDIPAAAKLMIPILHEERLPLRTWLQFLDSDLAVEWIGMYPGSPPPPM